MRLWSTFLALVPMLAPEVAQAQPAAQPPTSEVPDVVVEHPLPSPPPRPEAAIIVHIDSPHAVDLQIKDPNEDDRYQTVCTSPCDKWVPAFGQYRVVVAGLDRPGQAGRDPQSSRDFSLPANAQYDAITVKPRSLWMAVSGPLLAGVGGAMMVIGIPWWLWNSLLDSIGNSNLYDTATPHLLVFGGGALLATGIVLAVKSRTRSPRVHLATWREPSAEQRALPRAPSAPLFQIVF
jgi:hypothetical protein